MPMMDRFSTFCDATALPTGAPASFNVGTTLDLGKADPGDISQGGQTIYLVVEVTTTATSGGSATMAVRLASDDSSTLNTSTATIHFQSDYFPVATMTEDTVLVCIPLPNEGVAKYEQYLGIQVAVNAAALTAGAINAYLTHNPPKFEAFADGAPTPA